MKWTQTAHRFFVLSVTMALSLALLGGCAKPRTVIFQGVAMKRTNGDLIIFHDLDALLKGKGVLSLDETESEQLRRLSRMWPALSSDNCMATTAGDCVNVNCDTGIDCVYWVRKPNGEEVQYYPGLFIPLGSTYYCDCEEE